MNLKRPLKPSGRRILAAALTLLASGFAPAADSQPPKFFSIALIVRDGDYSQPPGHWANPEVNFDGLKTAFAMLDKAYEATAGPGAKFPAVIGLETVPTRPEYVAYIKERLAFGTASGMTGESFAYRVDNAKDAEQWQEFPADITQPFVTLYHCDPLRPEMARSVRVQFPQGMAGGAKFMDPAGSWIWTEARVPLKTTGKFTLKYNRMFPLGAAQPTANP